MSTKVKEKPILATFLIAIIIGLVCLIIFVLNYYQPQVELPPKLVLTNQKGEKTELLLTEYSWNYKGETKTFNSGIKDDKLLNYDFDTKNICFGSFDDIMYWSGVIIEFLPKYKNNGLIQTTYTYNTFSIEPSTNTNPIAVGNATAFKPTMQYGTNYVEITLNSEQGYATYIFKFVDIHNINVDKLNTDTMSATPEKIQEYLKTCSYSKYLNNVKVENDKVVIAYDYWINKEVTDDFALTLFATIDEINEIEFDFLYNKYATTTWNEETQKNDITIIDSMEPHIYKRDSFKLNDRFSIEELKGYLGR